MDCNKLDAAYTDGFSYTHKNPYHDKLDKFSSFVFRDLEAEQFRGKWRSDLFHNDSVLNVEIGSGFGHFMREYVSDHPTENFIGMDYKFKRAFTLAAQLSKIPTKNYKYLRAKGERLAFMFDNHEIDNLFLFFPDPWPKSKQKKKRLFNDHLLTTVHPLLTSTGKMFIKTDHDDYAKQMEEVIEQSHLFEVELKTFNLRKEHPEHMLSKYITKFEKIFIAQNIPTKAFVIKPK